MTAERAAKLFGAAEALRVAVGYQQTPRERALREPYLTAARSQMDEASWELAFAEGEAMTFEEAVDYALAREEEPIASASPASEGASADQPPVALTPREQEVAILVAKHLSNRQIASDLVISERTATTHVARILKKLGLHSRLQLASWMTDRDLPSSD